MKNDITQNPSTNAGRKSSKRDGLQGATRLHAQLAELHLSYVEQHFESNAKASALAHTTHVDYLAQLIDGEHLRRHDGATTRRIAAARFPVLKTLDQFDWSWPSNINQAHIRHLFRLGFVQEKANLIFIGNVGLGKSHLATAIAHTACLQGHTALFTTAINIINNLAAAQAGGGIKREMHKYQKPSILVIDELGYLPIDKFGADCLFQIISARYECSSTIVTSNRAFQHWGEIFNNDAVLASAILDRLLHHAETVLIEGQSYRMKEQIANLKS